MEARPPVLIESIVRLLVPPLAREHVLGDLQERYSSPERYLVEAFRTIPRVVVSQIRRTSYFPLWPLVGLTLAIGYSIGSDGIPLRATIAAFATLIAFMFRDAYRVPDLQHPGRHGLIDIAIVAIAVLGCQVLLTFVRPEWVLPRGGLAGGAGVLLALCYLRLQNPIGRVPSAS